MTNNTQQILKISLFKKLIYLIKLSHRKKIFILFILMITATAFEVLGLGLIVPLFSVIIDAFSQD